MPPSSQPTTTGEQDCRGGVDLGARAAQLRTNGTARYEARLLGRRDDVPLTDKRIVGHDMLVGLRSGIREHAQPMRYSPLLSLQYAFYPVHNWGTENLVPGIDALGIDGVINPPLCGTTYAPGRVKKMLWVVDPAFKLCDPPSVSMEFETRVEEPCRMVGLNNVHV